MVTELTDGGVSVVKVLPFLPISHIKSSGQFVLCFLSLRHISRSELGYILGKMNASREGIKFRFIDEPRDNPGSELE